MAVRTPLYNNSGTIQEMSSAQITELKDLFRYKFFTSNPIALSVVGSGGNIGSISDTRLQAGAASTSTTAFPNEATTAEPSVVTVTYDKITQTLATTPTLTSDTGTLYPVYLDASNNIRAMNLTDMLDTFVHPVIDELSSTDNTVTQAGTYFISTSSTAADANKTVVSVTPVFSDTRADTTLYTAGGIAETLDQPTTVTNYYLHRNIITAPTYTSPLIIEASNNLQEYPTATFESMIENIIKYTTLASTAGYTIRYSLGTSTANYSKGSGMSDTRLNGSGNYQTRFVNTDDYRAQEFPNGTPTTINTYYLRLIKA